MPAAATLDVPPAKRTNDGLRAQRNLESELRSLAKQHAARGLQRGRMERYVGLMLGRAEFFGAIEEYDRALAATAAYLERNPRLARAHRLRAQVLARLHRFDEAEAALDRAESLGASATALANQRIPIYAATGRLDRALALHDAFPPRDDDALAIGGRALLFAESGDTATAAAHLQRALQQQRGISPFPAAWVYMQLGLMWQRAGQAARAQDHFAAAVQRLPNYAPARAHLADLTAARGDVTEAIALLQPLVDVSTDPEYPGQLAGYLRAVGRTAEANAHLANAKRGYPALIARHPAAFADHAARFWLGAGADPARAHELALENLATRPTDAAFQLALDTAHAAAIDPVATCALAERAHALPAPSAYLLFTIARAYRTCHRQGEATAALTAAATARRPR